MNEIIERKIETLVEALVPNGTATISENRLRTVLEQIAAIAWQTAESKVLLDLLTVQDVAEQIGVSPRRARAIAAEKHARFGIGWQVPGSRGTWLFRPSEVEALRPGLAGWPKGRSRK